MLAIIANGNLNAFGIVVRRAPCVVVRIVPKPIVVPIVEAAGIARIKALYFGQEANQETREENPFFTGKTGSETIEVAKNFGQDFFIKQLKALTKKELNE